MRKILIITAIVVGVLLALQVRSFKNVESLVQRSAPGNILSQLRVFQLANEQLRTHIIDQQKVLEDLNTKLTKDVVEDEITRLRTLSGEVEVYGEGIEITLSKVVPEFWITDIVAQAVGTGAEAISINDIRLTLRTSGFRTVGNGLAMGHDFLRTPLRISIIGPQKELKQAIAQAGGIVDKMEAAYPGLVVLISTKTKVTIPAVEKL